MDEIAAASVSPIEGESELMLLRDKLAIAEERLEISQLNSKRLTKRLEAIMHQLKNTVRVL